MTFISYAQNYEDVMLRRALKGVAQGWYVDVGAQDPVIDSVTKAFYEAGWRGINIEPASQWLARLIEDRPGDINLGVAAAAENGILKLFEVADTGLSTVDPEAARAAAARGFRIIEREIPARRLDDILTQHRASEIHFLKIDVEGFEAEVLRGIDLVRFRPWIIVVEATVPDTPTPTHAVWEKPALLDRGYLFTYFDGINRYYLAVEHAQLRQAFAVPPNYFDDFVRYGEWNASRQVNTLKTAATASQKLANDLKEILSEKQEESRWLTTAYSEARSQVWQIEGQLIGVREHGEWVEQQWRADCEKLTRQVQRVEWLEHEWNAAKATIETQVQRVEWLEREWNAAKATIETQVQRTAWLEHEWNAAKATNEETRQQIHYWWSVADNLSRELQQLRATRSWRLTAPLRAIDRIVAQRAHPVGWKTPIIATLPRRAVRRVLIVALTHLRARPKQMAIVASVLARVPRLDARLRGFAYANSGRQTAVLAPEEPPVPSSASDADQDGIDWAAHPPSVRRAFQQLMEARLLAQTSTSRHRDETDGAA